ncbi:uncharacterized protein LOC128895293 isoform X2 [Hylaeus anthracinus]|uniref:uncharacterized protein LOC128895293 isoform X2 n=1 Tax=Hylaeus anthracinus TaxID=313031 RepID=UPI0023B8A268|nr:uncharacterized protein LOC128895293 isoform X2 [Hylaeus anthracinus]XP_054013754.1 uncharacterized protein LOC128895293 isoform X2 [Hylaeus anthracinus]
MPSSTDRGKAYRERRRLEDERILKFGTDEEKRSLLERKEARKESVRRAVMNHRKVKSVTKPDQLSKEKVSTQYSSHREEESKKKIIEVIERRGKKRAKFVAEKDFKDSAQILSKEPDDYDTFGEYVAMELRSLRSDENKRRLKAEIRRAICRIADLDDATIYAFCASPNTSQSCPLPLPSSSSSSSSTYHIP